MAISFANPNPNQNGTILDQLPRVEGTIQRFNIDHQPQGKNPRNDGSLSNHIQSTTNNNYVGLRISTNGELVGKTHENLPTVHGNGVISSINHTEETNDLVNHFSELDDWNVYLPSVDQNATQQEMSNMHGNSGDELRQLGIDIQVNQVTNLIN